MEIEEKREKLKNQFKELEEAQKELIESDTFVLSTNTAYLQNAKITDAFRGYGFFPDWVKIKHQQSWEKKSSSIVEITFKIIKEKFEHE